MNDAGQETDIIKHYLAGKGIDISRNKQITLDNVKHISIGRNGLFSLRGAGERESFDFVYCADIADTKFYPVIIKEMLYAVKIGGFIVVELKGNSIMPFTQLAKEAKILLMDKAGVRQEDSTKKILVFQKINSCLEKNDTIDRWTFGFISSGKKNEQIDRQIEIIKKLGVPNYEIIVCGTYYDRKEKNFRYIKFNELDDKGWITRKKNLICEKAKYENLVIMHDRIMPNPDFYAGLKKYGNYFDVLSCAVKNDKGERCGDWMTYGNDFNALPRIGNLSYDDWDKKIWIDGALFIMKKSAWRVVQFDESLFWNQGEDKKMAADWKLKGLVPRFNPFSSCLTLSWRHGVLPDFEFDEKRLGKRKVNALIKLREYGRFYIKPIIQRKLRNQTVS